MKIKARRSCYVIAEAGVNHNGDLLAAKELIHAAKDATADAVKFQAFVPELVVHHDAPLAEYQKVDSSAHSQLDLIRPLALSDQAFYELYEEAKAVGLDFLASPFDSLSLSFLVNQLGLKQVKVASGEITNAKLLWNIGQMGVHVIVSTGASNLGEIEFALSVLASGAVAGEVPPTRKAAIDLLARAEAWEYLQENVSLLHCVTNYPSEPQEANLRALSTLYTAFGLGTGFSDHSLGWHLPVAAVALGASIVEKHLTLDRTLQGPDHYASLEPDEFAKMIDMIRDVEMGLGNGRKLPALSEFNNRPLVRRSLVASDHIDVGEIFTPNNLDSKRPETGVSADQWLELLQTGSTREYGNGEFVGDQS